MGEVMIEATLVIPTRGDDRALRRIATQILPSHNGPVVLVVNGARPMAMGALPDLPGARIYACPGGGVSRARNLALRLAPSDLIVFVDDDVLLTPTVIERIVDDLCSGRGDVVTGRILPAQATAPFGEVHTEFLGLDRGAESQLFDETALATLSPTGVWALGVGALFGVNRASLLDVARPPVFDESLSNGRFCGGAEDSDFLLQAVLSGLTVLYDAEAVATHQFPVRKQEVERKMHQYARADGAFYAKWSELLTHKDLLTDLRCWWTRLGEHVRLARKGHPHVPLGPLVTEPFDKTVGYAWWMMTGRS